jgi:para-nitrobenzyl esterase
MHKDKILTRAALIIVADVCAHVIVTSASGKLQGISGEKVVSFRGIPYGKAPVGDLRWKAPSPVEAWSGVRKANSFPPGCIQRKVLERLPWSREFMLQAPTSEDCLYLNVWTPSNFHSRKLPVYVFFHGGGFIEGAGSIDVYDGSNLAQKGLVVVTVNYRLGALGFLAHPALSAESVLHVSGNYGFLDAVASLQWVKDNIAAFGGDVTKVTIGGQSACGYRKLRPSWKRENLVCMPTLCAGETDRSNHSVAIQRRSESQSGESKEQSGVSSRPDCFGS